MPCSSSEVSGKMYTLVDTKLLSKFVGFPDIPDFLDIPDIPDTLDFPDISNIPDFPDNPDNFPDIPESAGGDDQNSPLHSPTIHARC